MAYSSAPIPTEIDIAIIGAGPHALTLVAHLLQKCQKIQSRFLVFDKSGRWMSQWFHAFAALEIPHLRSPAVHHPDPNPYALRSFAESRPTELHSPYDLPGTQLFQDFCLHLIERWQLNKCIVPAQVTRIEPLIPMRKTRFRLWLDNGHSVIARRVVLATGGGVPSLPEWVSHISTPYPQERLCHSHDVNLRSLQLAGERVLIVGGGLTSGHLAVGAIARGARVILMARRDFQEKLFDADPGWLGPKYLKGFWAETDWHNRWQMIQQARNGGSFTPAMMTQLRRAYHSGAISLHERCQIVEAIWKDNYWQVRCHDGTEHQCDRIWIATGTKLDVTANSMLSEVLDGFPTAIVNGLPVLDTYLRWPRCELFVMGGLAALQIGPVARNLYGARMASDRIVPALTKASLAL
ncbi:MAG: FAD/NAD(P)-binding protein [Coleofasciculaceae cyanobacterium]